VDTAIAQAGGLSASASVARRPTAPERAAGAPVSGDLDGTGRRGRCAHLAGAARLPAPDRDAPHGQSSHSRTAPVGCVEGQTFSARAAVSSCIEAAAPHALEPRGRAGARGTPCRLRGGIALHRRGRPARSRAAGPDGRAAGPGQPHGSGRRDAAVGGVTAHRCGQTSRFPGRSHSTSSTGGGTPHGSPRRDAAVGGGTAHRCGHTSRWR
jgi:hypothetical protein